MMMHPASCAVTRLEIYWYDVLIGRATGFIYNNAGETCLVSNWHVFAGKNASTLKVLNKDGMTPTRVRFHVTCASFKPGGVEYSFLPMKADLIREGAACWWQHGGYLDGEGIPRIVDIGVLPLAGVLSDVDPAELQSFENQVIVQEDGNGDLRYQQGTASIGSEVFILGYPNGLANQGVYPVWKRGSIASEPLYPIVDTIPAMYVDTLTRHGMSGSSTILIGDGLIGMDGFPVERKPQDDPWLIGVYAGRTGSTGEELEMALGRVWKKACLDEIFKHRLAGGSDLAR